MIELVPDAIIVLSAEGRIVLVNRQTERMFGYLRDSLLDHPVEILIPHSPNGDHPLLSANSISAPRISPLGSGARLVGRRQDGDEFPIEVSLNRLNTDGEALIIATVHDISELKRTEEARAALEATSQEQRQLLALTDTALSNLALDDLLGELLRRVQEATNADNVAILLLDENGRELQLMAARGLEEEVVGKARIPAGQGFAGRIVATRAPLIVDDLPSFPVVNPVLRKLNSTVGVPLLAGERLIGVLHVDSLEPAHFSSQDIPALKLVGERIALAVERSQLYEATLAARAEAERQRARWQATMDSAPAFVITCDAELRLTYINPLYERLLGSHINLTTHVAKDFGLFGLLPDGSGPITPEQTPLARAVREQRVISNVELLYRSPSGEEYLIRWDSAPMRAEDGSLLGAVSVGWDITEQRRLERVAQEHSAQLEAIIEAITDGLVVYDVEGRVILANAAAREQLPRFVPDTEAEKLYERNTQTQVTTESGEPVPKEQWALARALRGEVISGANPLEVVVRALNGDLVSFSVTAAPLRDTTGAIVGAIAVHCDVTARKQLEREGEEARARELAALEVSQRLDEFFAIAAHDIRNPVTTVYTSVQMLQRRLNRLRDAFAAGGSDAELAALEAFDNSLRSSRNSVERLIRLIDRLFDIVQARAGKLELKLAPCDLTAIVREQVMAQRTAQPDRTIALELPSDQPATVTADTDRIGEVLANYLTNANKYSPAHLPITVRLEVANGRATVSVRDLGPGLPPEKRLLIWEMFHRESSAEMLKMEEGQDNGLGLGLHICKRLMEAHPGGQVGVESEVGAGSTFWFSLPLKDGAPALDAS